MNAFFNALNQIYGLILGDVVFIRKRSNKTFQILLKSKVYYFRVRVVFKWIVKAFSGHLPPEQLLNLWDIILAYDSLEIIPLLAVIILVFRKDNLMKVNTIPSVDAVLSDLSSITVIPLLQMALLKE